MEVHALVALSMDGSVPTFRRAIVPERHGESRKRTCFSTAVVEYGWPCASIEVSWQKRRVLCRLWYWLCRIFHFGETVHKYTVGVSIVQLAAPAFAEYGGMCAVCHKVLDRMRASRRILQRHRMLIKAPLLKALLVYGPCRRVAMVKALLSCCCYAMVKALLLRLVPSFRSAIVPERHGESAALEVKSVALRRGLGRHGGTLFSLRIEGSVCWIACL